MGIGFFSNNHKFLRNYLFLFDIDGTILDTQGEGSKAFKKTLRKVLNITNQQIDFRGAIDKVIFDSYYKTTDFDCNLINQYWEKFKMEYGKLLEQSDVRKWIIFKNVKSVIKFLYEHSHVAVVTGNCEIGAKIKLKKAGLLEYLFLGSYGEQNVERKFIVKEAINRYSISKNKNFDKKHIFLFGDTQKDIESSFKNNIHSILIDNYNAQNNIDTTQCFFIGTFENFDKLFIKLKKYNDNLLS